MRITQESDYALRICAALAQANKLVSSTHLSEELCIPQQFTSKIMRELMLAGLVKSTRGVNGGFSLNVNADTLTLRNIIEAVDGTILIRHCLSNNHICTYQKDKIKCRFHRVFDELNSIITNRLDTLTLADMVNAEIPTDKLIEKLHID